MLVLNRRSSKSKLLYHPHRNGAIKFDEKIPEQPDKIKLVKKQTHII